MAEPVWLPTVSLDAELDGSVTAKWQQIALTGEFNGYAGGAMPFVFDKAMFEQIVQNFRAHPSFKLGVGGAGAADVVQWDFHHASEAPPTEGDIAIAGAPAQGWVLDLQVRDGAAGAELWALTRWLEPARSFIAKGQYKWASVAVVFNAVDPKSGEEIGAVLTSVALTNKPFIEGMEQLVASKDNLPPQGGTTKMGNMTFQRIATKVRLNTAEEMMDHIRWILGLAETDGTAEAVAELAKVQAWMAAGEAPAGIDLEEFVERFKSTLNLPLLATMEEVGMEIAKLLASLTAPEVDESPEAADAVATSKDDQMDFIATLAKKLGVKPEEAAVTAAIAELFSIRDNVAKAVGLTADASNAVVTKKVTAAGDALDGLRSIFSALGVEDVEGAVSKIAEDAKRVGELEKVMPELEGLRSAKVETEEKEREEDIAAAVQHHFSGDEKHGVMLAVFHKTSGREAFLELYPTPDPAKVALTQTISTEVQGGEGKPKAPAGGPTGGDKTDRINLAEYPGANPVDRAVQALLATNPEAKNWTWDIRWQEACTLIRSGRAYMPEATN